jgi:aldehyde:ferredoxin oxidoreductase
MGPVTVMEYESRVERYDKQLINEVGINPISLTSEEKVAALRKFRMNRYD